VQTLESQHSLWIYHEHTMMVILDDKDRSHRAPVERKGRSIFETSWCIARLLQGSAKKRSSMYQKNQTMVNIYDL
jgi:hypothetical protein